MAPPISKKRKFVADGVFRAELGEFFTRELAEEGYSGCEVRETHSRTEIIIRATHTQEILGERGRRIRELTSLVRKRFKFPEDSLELFAEKVQNRGLSAVAQCESLRYKLLGGLAVRRACYGVLRFVMESGARGCEIVISGKLRAARAKAMKFTDGFLVHSGQPAKDFVDCAVRHVLLRQGVLGLKVKILNLVGPKDSRYPLPDYVEHRDPPIEKVYSEPFSEQRGPANMDPVAAPVAEEQEYVEPQEYADYQEYVEPQEYADYREHVDQPADF
ncbi:40S ribosomal protein S3 [Tulasnella sp. 331]|nr:40S ribosomal protein S3 [Tulasnella sp. 331]